MTNRDIDLMPKDVRARAEAGQRVRRAVGVCLVIAGLAGGAATWAHIRSERASSELVRLEAMASQSLELESQAAACGHAAEAIESAIHDYHAVALPMPVTSLVAGIVESLPSGGTLESLSIAYDDGRRLGADEASPRRLLGTIEGFASTDEDVAVLARRLAAQSPFENVRLEASRSKVVRGRPARGFSILFGITLDRTFIVRRPGEVDVGGSMAKAEEAGQ
ncbi:MAG: PilN domain-containing protein [Phycisphaerales bacterium]|jgi:hypothetical protein|nr:PilN domain-containing protein [Phycisphaerales bacterium]